MEKMYKIYKEDSKGQIMYSIAKKFGFYSQYNQSPMEFEHLDCCFEHLP